MGHSNNWEGEEHAARLLLLLLLLLLNNTPPPGLGRNDVNGDATSMVECRRIDKKKEYEHIRLLVRYGATVTFLPSITTGSTGTGINVA